ncbi:hypothetical protein CSKR_105122 [Clonorchis sinensis]|uniref:Uncharacterized protein n=1 Tax=Clonorchis sinensis TaxID=79923 RepID=A0A8T1MN24_CLOSI|nr:hypothetical protein CSKR_105122 [Clonorchis sinensis]
MVKHNLHWSDIVRTICLISMGLCVELDCLIVQEEHNTSCKALGAFCRKLPFNQRCCGTTACELRAIFRGTCVNCIPPGKHIWTTRLFCLLEGKQYAM